MNKPKQIEIQDFQLWEKKKDHQHSLFSFELELTARCNLNCRHCYINLPANNKVAKAEELSMEEISDIADQAVELGAMWVLVTGGEPLLRDDFPEIYLMLKRKGLLVSVFTNATLIHEEHINLFMRYPPRDIEVTIYGSSQDNYETITRKKGSFIAFQRGMMSLVNSGVKVRLKAMALRSNLSDIDAIAALGKQYTKDFYRFDPVLHLRYDGNAMRNNEIISERLTPEEIVELERSDHARFDSLKKNRKVYINDSSEENQDTQLFHCGIGKGNFTVGFDGTFRLCSSLWGPGTTRNLRQDNLQEVWDKFVPSVQNMQTENLELLNTCGKCPIANLCLNCPAHAYLETGKMDAIVPYFCRVAHQRADQLLRNNQSLDEDD